MQFGKLVIFEVKKAIGGKFFAAAFFLLLAVNSLLWCKNLSNFGNAREVTEMFGDSCEVLASLTPEEKEAFEAAMVETYGEDVFSAAFFPPAEMLMPPGYFGDFDDFGMVSTYKELQKINEENTGVYENVLKAAKSFGREAVKEGNDYEIRRNLNIIRLYSAPREKIQYFVYGWQTFLFGSHTMILVLLLVLLVCAGIFTKETESQAWLLLHTAKNGKGKTLAAKFLTAAICAAGITLLFQGASLLTVFCNEGLLGGDQSIAAIGELKVFPFLFTVKQYALLVVLCQMFAAIIMSVLFSAISAFSKSGVISYAVGGLFLGGCTALSFYPPKTEWLAGPLSLMKPERYFQTFYTANLLGEPVLWAVVQVVLWSVLGAVCIWLSQMIYHRKRRRI